LKQNFFIKQNVMSWFQCARPCPGKGKGKRGFA